MHNMTIAEYTTNLINLSSRPTYSIEAQEFLKQYSPNLERLKNHNNLESIEGKLVPSMASILPFIDTPFKFTSVSLDKFLKIQNTFDKDPFLIKDLETVYINALSRKFNTSKNCFYHNLGILLPQFVSYLELINKKSSFEQELISFKNNLDSESLNRDNISWINSFHCIDPRISLCSKDYLTHINQVYTDIKQEFNSDIQLYFSRDKILKSITKNELKKESSVQKRPLVVVKKNVTNIS